MPRLAMSLIVRNELEFIAANIAFHASQGVDHFVIMDNGSTDGTRECIESLQSCYDIDLIDQPERDFRQGEWATELAYRARERGKAEHIISNDADEFWVSRMGSLKHACSGGVPVVKAPRTNVLPFSDQLALPDYQFQDCILNVVAPFGAMRKASDPKVPLNVPIMLRTMGPKVLCAIDGLSQVGRGNHQVEHRAGDPVLSDHLHVYHFPVRSWTGFSAKVRFAKERFEREQGVDKKISWHLRRWVAQLELGTLMDEWRSFGLDKDYAADLETRGVIRRDDTVRRLLMAQESRASEASKLTHAQECMT